MRYTFGEMVLRTMKSEKINRKDLHYGLCSAASFTKYIKGEQHIDRLLMTVLMQRLGRSPDKFCTMLTEEEYVYFLWRQEAELAVQHGEWSRTEELLEEPEARDESCNPALQRQFLLMMQGIVREKRYADREGSFRLLEEAAALTVPGFRAGIHENTRLGVQEINIMLLWQKLHPDREEAFRFLESLLKNIDAHYTDRQEKSRIYPLAAAQFLAMLNDRERYYECISMARKALELIMATGYGNGIEQVLKSYAAAAEKLRTPDWEQVKLQLEMWRELLEEYRSSTEEEAGDIYLFGASQEMELVNEMISRVRRERGLTQEELSKDICEPATLSRIENGKRGPARRTYQALARKLSLPEEYYYSTIATENFEVLEQRGEYEMQIAEKKWEEAERLKGLLEENLDRSIICNRQYLEQADFILEKNTGKIKMEDSIERLKGILSCSIPEMPEGEQVDQWPEQFWRHVFTEREMSILLQVADALSAGKKREQAIYLLEKMLECYGRSKVKPEVHYRVVLLIYGRLSGQYGILGRYEKEFKYAEKGIQLSIQKGTYKSLPHFLNNKADGLENLDRKEDALKYYKMAFTIAKTLQRDRLDIAARSYKKLSGTDIE